MLEKLGCFVNKHKGDEKVNINLAIELCKNENEESIKDIIKGLKNKNKDIANDCIKVLYEIGYRKPELISKYSQDFLILLSSKNNRLVWGAMIALKTIVATNPDEIFNNIKIIINGYKKGGTITIDNAIRVLSELASINNKYEKEIFPILLNHLETCEIKNLPQRAERIIVCVNVNNEDMFLKTINKRVDDLSSSQLSRINKLKKQLLP